MIIYYTDNFTGGREESRRLLEKALAVHTGDEKQAKTLTDWMYSSAENAISQR